MASVQRRSGSAGLDGRGAAAACSGWRACVSLIPSTPRLMHRPGGRGPHPAPPGCRWCGAAPASWSSDSLACTTPPSNRVAIGKPLRLKTASIGALRASTSACRLARPAARAIRDDVPHQEAGDAEPLVVLLDGEGHLGAAIRKVGVEHHVARAPDDDLLVARSDRGQESDSAVEIRPGDALQVGVADFSLVREEAGVDRLAHELVESLADLGAIVGASPPQGDLRAVLQRMFEDVASRLQHSPNSCFWVHRPLGAPGPLSCRCGPPWRRPGPDQTSRWASTRPLRTAALRAAWSRSAWSA